MLKSLSFTKLKLFHKVSVIGCFHEGRTYTKMPVLNFASILDHGIPYRVSLNLPHLPHFSEFQPVNYCKSSTVLQLFVAERKQRSRSCYFYSDASITKQVLKSLLPILCISRDFSLIYYFQIWGKAIWVPKLTNNLSQKPSFFANS